MALKGVPLKGQPVRKTKEVEVVTQNDPKTLGEIEAQKSALEARDQFVNVLQDKIQAFNDFIDQFEEILERDGDGIKAVCDEMEIEVKGNTPQRDMLSLIFKKMQLTMLDSE